MRDETIEKITQNTGLTREQILYAENALKQVGIRMVEDGTAKEDRWRPIATAPSDKAVMLYDDDYFIGEMIDGVWNTDGAVIAPEYWRPLPDPPLNES